MSIEVGKKAPLFTLHDQDGNKVALKDFREQKVVLYFYPKDMTPGCTTQACDFRDNLSKFKKRGVKVLGISRDPGAKHQQFAEQYSLNFPLLADENGEVCEKYGVWQEKKLYGKTSMGIVRTTFIIDETGVIEKIFSRVKVNGHVEKVLAELASE